MGGFGSGVRYWQTKCSTTESCNAIDIRFLHRQGRLTPGSQGILSWTCNGNPSGTVEFRAF
jgi:hypothetical protein